MVCRVAILGYVIAKEDTKKGTIVEPSRAISSLQEFRFRVDSLEANKDARDDRNSVRAFYRSRRSKILVFSRRR